MNVLDHNGEWEDIEKFPQNRTLYVDQFSEDGPYGDLDRTVFQAQNLEEVFAHYRPSVDIELLTEEGGVVTEHFTMLSIDDFEDEHLMAQSETLQAATLRMETYNNIICQLERNKNLRDTLNDETVRGELNDIVKFFLLTIQEGKTINQPSFPNFPKSFALLQRLVKDIQYLDPEHPALRDIFLSDPYYSDTRQKLKSELDIWGSVIAAYDTDLATTMRACVTSCDNATLNLQNNLTSIHEALLPLEVTYRTLDTFFANTGGEKAPCTSLINVRKSKLTSFDSEDTLSVYNELNQYYDRLDLTNSYSLLVIPGYLGDADIVRKWAELAFKNKVIMVTDFEDVRDFKDLKDELRRANLQGQDMALSNVVMTCNYLLGRKKSELAEENDDVYLPGSGALAGRMVNVEEISIAQGAVGREYGLLNQVNGTRLYLLKSEIEVLVDQGVVPLVEDDGLTMAFSNRSLYNGSNISLQEYPVVRVFDWVKKVLMNYMHEITLETWDPYKSSQKLKDKIQKFLNHYRGHKNLFSNFKLGDPFQDPDKKIVTVDISITPFYVGKNFTIKLTADDKRKVKAETQLDE